MTKAELLVPRTAMAARGEMMENFMMFERS